ncbi:DUF3152 domain-containing protein [Catellatospora bangladeshensis]|uniref:DUF3152 domain-containing protein n=1 Tax=Catellatospora bangladeshensis TaxID=310355 RepID=UPI0019452924|nr:DUF3152 domain-containing protein [Catellatospora bangladeshensis]
MGRIRVTTVALLMLALAGCGSAPQPQPQFQAASPESAPVTAEASPSAPPSPSPSAKPKPTKNTPVLQRGGGTFHTAAGGTDIVGSAGSLRRYQVQVEKGITAFDTDGFAAKVDEILSDDRSWIASKKWRLQRVGPGESPNFYVKLATPDTVDRLCGQVGLITNGIFSCRAGSNVVINLRRWTNGADGFTDMEVYRSMVINHEVGHFLGHGHVFCPGKGRLAPVMQQQTKGLQGCKANPYPYPDGVHYVG